MILALRWIFSLSRLTYVWNEIAFFSPKTGKIAKNEREKPVFACESLWKVWNAEISSHATLEYGVFEIGSFRKICTISGHRPSVFGQITRYGYLRGLEFREISFHSRVT